MLSLTAVTFLISYKYFAMEGLAKSPDDEYLIEYCHHILALKESRTLTNWTTINTAVDTDKSPLKQGKHISERKKKKGKKGKKRKKDKDKKDKDKGKDYQFMPKDCSSLYQAGVRRSGIYSIYFRPALGTEIKAKVYCDMESAGGGWTVFQRRGDFGTPHINFTRDWLDYSMGFGNLNEEFWLGNENIHRLTMQDNVALRVELKGFDGRFHYANYDIFSVGGYKDNYVLQVGKYSGNAGDSLEYHNGYEFVTFDHNDRFNCSKIHRGGWWYGDCMTTNLNGLYLGNKIFWDGITWFDITHDYHSYKWAEMKLRAKYFRN